MRYLFAAIGLLVGYELLVKGLELRRRRQVSNADIYEEARKDRIRVLGYRGDVDA
jgi:hypothetical protein